MSFDDLLSTALSLARPDKLRLILRLAEDLGNHRVSSPNFRNGACAEEPGMEEEEQLRDAIAVIGTRHAATLMSEEDVLAPVESSPFEAKPSVPYWKPDHEAEAASILMSRLEAEKAIL